MKIDFSRVKVIVFGDIILDDYWYGICERISPEAPVPVVNVKKRESRLGGAANVALNCRSLGASVTLVGSVGKDESGKELISLVQAAGINSQIIIKPKAITTKKTRIVAGLQQITRVDSECNPMEHYHEDFLSFKSLISDADIVVVSDYAKGFVHHANKIIEIAKKNKKRILVDPKKQNYLNYSGASLITPNLKEFETMVGLSRNEDEIEIKARSIIKKLDLECLVLTRGSDGMTLFQGTKGHSIPTVAKEVFDVSGAGDTVIASLALGLSVGMSFEDAVIFSNKCSSIAVSRFGTTSVTLADLGL